jgi:hypothetical protein
MNFPCARRYKWVWHGAERLYQVGILPDGSLYKPNNYPEDIVRRAVQAADARRHERRSKAAKLAGETRRQRQARKVYAVAKGEARIIGPRNNCYICGRGLSDAESITRGIGRTAGKTC